MDPHGALPRWSEVIEVSHLEMREYPTTFYWTEKRRLVA